MCKLVEKTGCSCIFLEKSAIHIKKVARFLRKVQLILETGWSCTFLEKSATHIENRLHASLKGSNSFQNAVGVAYFLRKVQLILRLGLS
jgi:hypothetical protein